MPSQFSPLIQRSYLDFARPRHGVGAALGPGEGFVHVLDVPEPEAGDEISGG